METMQYLSQTAQPLPASEQQLTALSAEELRNTGGGGWLRWLPLIADEFDDLKRGIIDAFRGRYSY
jgi:hypothetical protein